MRDTREYIIDRAYKLFLNHNYEAVSISDISKEIGFTKGALYHHFKNKEELFKAVVDKHFDLTGIKVDVDTVSLKEYTDLLINHIHHILKTLFRKDEKFRPINYHSLFIDSFRHYEGFAEDKYKFFEEQNNKVKHIVDNAIKSGEIRSDINTSVVALQYFSLSVSLAGDILLSNSIDSAVKSIKEQLYQLYELLRK